MQESLHSWSLFSNQNRDSKTKLKLHSHQLRAIRSSRPPTGSFAPKQCFLPVSIKFTSCPRINGSIRKNHVSMFPHFLFSDTWFYRRQFYVASFPFSGILITSAIWTSPHVTTVIFLGSIEITSALLECFKIIFPDFIPVLSDTLSVFITKLLLLWISQVDVVAEDFPFDLQEYWQHQGKKCNATITPSKF